jgi:hypothetical protein
VTRTSIAAVVSVAAFMQFTPPVHAAEEGPGATAFLLSPDSRVRGLDSTSRRLLETGAACSPTFARVLQDLQASDLIVGVETRPMPKKVRGELRLVAASAAVRYVRVGLQVPNAERDLVAVLGHELHHATEVAAAPEVRDARTQRAHYLRIGYEPQGRGFYETDAALEAGRVVAREIAGCGTR